MSFQSVNPTLLYVEDEFLIQQMFLMELEDAGFSVLPASNGTNALAVLADQSQPLDGLITDINLGEGPDGWEIARTARETKGGLPVIYLSAAIPRDWTSHGVPGSLMMGKPFLAAQVIAAIRSLLPVRL